MQPRMTCRKLRLISFICFVNSDVDGEIGNRQVMFGYAFILFSHVGSVDDKNSNEGSAEDGRDLVFASESFLSNNLLSILKQL